MHTPTHVCIYKNVSCMYVRVCVYEAARTHIYMHADMHMCGHDCMYMSACANMYMYKIWQGTCWYTCMCTCVCARV